jgi:hypothetical protein
MIGAGAQIVKFRQDLQDVLKIDKINPVHPENILLILSHGFLSK